MAPEVAAATMSDNDHASHGTAAAQGDDNGDAHGHDAHGHGADTLGAIDWRMWGVGVVGVVVALVVVAGFVAATGFTFNA